MKYDRLTRCRICNSSLGVPFLDLGEQPLANNLQEYPTPFEHTPVAPLQLVVCPNPQCRHIQLSVVVDPREMFDNYLYASGVSTFFQEHFESLALEVTQLDAEGTRGLWLDIGSGDGTLLKKAQELGWDVVGVEPAEGLAEQSGVPTQIAYWSDTAAARVETLVGKPKVISATNVFAHVDDCIGFLKAAADILTDDGFIVIEVPDATTMLKEGTFDLVYHEHLSYFHAQSISRLMQVAGLGLLDIVKIPSHGGSLRLYIGKEGGRIPTYFYNLHKDIRQFKKFVQEWREEFTEIVKQFEGRVVGYGAPAKATVAIHACGLDAEDIDFIMDDNELKQDKIIPGTGIPVLSPKQKDSAERDQHRLRLSEDIDAVIIFPWNLVEGIMSRMTPGAYKLIIPHPLEVREWD